MSKRMINFVRKGPTGRQIQKTYLAMKTAAGPLTMAAWEPRSWTSCE